MSGMFYYTVGENENELYVGDITKWNVCNVTTCELFSESGSRITAQLYFGNSDMCDGGNLA